MATGFRSFATDTIGSAAPGVTLVGIGTGTANVEAVTGASGGRAMVLRPQAGNRHVLALLDAITALGATNFEVMARVRFPSGLSGFFNGGGPIARVTPTPNYAGYGGVYNESGFANENSITNGNQGTGPAQIAGAAVVVWPNVSNVWLRVLLRVNGSNIRAWFGNDSGWTKTNASTPDAEATNTDHATGTAAGIYWDTNTSLPMEVDWFSYGTDGDAAPTSAGSPATLSAPTPSGTLGTATTATIGATTNQNTGTFFAVVGTGSQLTGVTAAQIKAGQQASGAAALAAGNAAISTTSPSVGVTGLTAATAYTYAAIQNNPNGDSNIVTGTFTTAAAPVVRPRRRFASLARRPSFHVRP